MLEGVRGGREVLEVGGDERRGGWDGNWGRKTLSCMGSMTIMH